MRTTLRVERLDGRDTPAVFANPLVVAVAQQQALAQQALVQQALVQQTLVEQSLIQQAMLRPPVVAAPPAVVTPPPPITTAAITLSTPTGSLALPAQPFLLTRPFPGSPQVFSLTTAGGSLAFTGPFTFTSPLFSLSVGAMAPGAVTPMAGPMAHPPPLAPLRVA
jgi:hypothetical protein